MRLVHEVFQGAGSGFRAQGSMEYFRAWDSPDSKQDWD